MNDHVILITGAARGIGAAAARAFAARGARLALVGLEPEELARVAAACGPTATWHEADVADAAAVARAVEEALAHHGRLDVVVANAGVALLGPLHLQDPADVARTVQVNLLGTFNTVRASAQALIASRGYLLCNASIAAIAPTPALGAYAASKAGIDAMADVLRAELHHHGVGVGVAYFSWIDTDLVRGGDGHPAFSGMRSRLPAPMRRIAPVGEATDALLRAVDGRLDRVTAPRWLAASLPLRGLVRLLVGREARRDAAGIEARWSAVAAEHGIAEASRPAGPARSGMDPSVGGSAAGTVR